MRADDAAQSAAHAKVRCEEKKAQLQQLKMEMNTQLSSAVDETCNAPLEVSKRIDSLYLKGCSSPKDRFSHQLDLIHGNQVVLDKLQKRIDSLVKCCRRNGEDSASSGCHCIQCWEMRAQRTQKMAETCEMAAEVARKQSGGYRAQSAGAVKAPRAAKHLRSLRQAANLGEVTTECVPVQEIPSSARLLRRARQPSTPSAAKFLSDHGKTTQEGFPAIIASESSRPRSASCVLDKRRRSRFSSEDF